LSKGDKEERLLAIPLGLHGGSAFPADVDVEPGADRYVGFYENEHGEQLVFVRERGEQPMLYHGDYGWSPLRAGWPERKKMPPLASLSPWVSGELILNQGEVLWLASCLSASGSMEEGDLGEGPLDRLLMQAVKDVFQRESEQFDQKWSLREKAVDRWKEKQGSEPTFEEEHYAEGAILVVLGLNAKQRRPRSGVTKEIRERIEREAPDVVREVQG
jgi:hypothetical protein